MKIKAIILTSIFLTVDLYANITPCPLTDGINVHTTKHILNICKNGTVIETFKIALGYNGIGKKKTGDNKTPIGLYGLAHPRTSSKYKIFIPILYPTAKQVAAGYTGRDVGIHGPNAAPSLFGWLNHLPYSTRGCIAVGKNNYIQNVANWVKANPSTKILII
ncbi:MAG: L,D-transpeptidase family protein [Legionella sp.]|nr:L,D-transpeptidase family protein [Legionella sp.]